jgi:hypothetical protein
MTLAVVLATGPSMTQEIADTVRGRCDVVIAVNRSFRLYPDADALVSNDRSWWTANKDALGFAGRKFCAFRLPGTERLNASHECPGGTNSGMQAMRVARDYFAASRILLCGFDMQGETVGGRTNFKPFLKQFRKWTGPEVINCTPGSALTRFPFMELDAALRPR